MGAPFAPRTNDTPLERFMKRVRKTESCWLWGPITGHAYGVFYLRESKKSFVAHRWLYQQVVGPVPQGKELHHECNNKKCVNPSHLRPVTHRENCLVSENNACAKHARQTHCKHGHELTPENVYVFTRTYRQCKCCKKETERKRRRS